MGAMACGPSGDSGVASSLRVVLLLTVVFFVPLVVIRTVNRSDRSSDCSLAEASGSMPSSLFKLDVGFSISTTWFARRRCLVHCLSSTTSTSPDLSWAVSASAGLVRIDRGNGVVVVVGCGRSSVHPDALAAPHSYKYFTAVISIRCIGGGDAAVALYPARPALSTALFTVGPTFLFVRTLLERYFSGARIPLKSSIW